MRKFMKRVSALILSSALVLAMGVTAFAANDLEDQVGIDSGWSTEQITDLGNSVNVFKELKITNSSAGNVYYPTVGYTYTIAPATVDDSETTTVTDTQPVTARVYSGEAAALSTTSAQVSFSSTDANNSLAKASASSTGGAIANPISDASAGVKLYKYFTVSFNPTQFSHPGVFRYSIEEAEDSTNTRAKANVEKQDSTSYEGTRYLDVYVYSPDGTTTSQIIYGYVLWIESAQNTKDVAITAVPNVSKTNGYVDATGGDQYNTYNLIVKKNITGALADQNHKFPFQVKLTGTNTTPAAFDYKLSSASNNVTGNTVSTTETTIGELVENSTVIALSNAETVTFYGLPSGTIAKVQERNDTYDVYSYVYEGDGTNNSSKKITTKVDMQPRTNSELVEGIVNGVTTTTPASADSEITFTNTIAVISPTGVVLRFAPYALMLGAGIILLGLSRRSRREDA